MSEATGQKRNRNLKNAIGWNVAGRFAMILANLAQVPLALHYLRPEEFGLWMTLIGTIQLMNFTDLGLGLGLQNKISQACGKDDLRLVRDLHYTCKIVLGSAAVIIFLTALPFLLSMDWATILHVEDIELRSNIKRILLIMLACFCLNLATNAGTRLATGTQNSGLIGIWSAWNSFALLGVVFICSICKISFVPFFTVAMALYPIMNTAVEIHVKKILGRDFRENKPEFKKDLLGEIFRTGMGFFIPQVGASIINFAPPLIITSALGPAAVIPFSLSQRLSNVVLQLQQLPLQPLWPAYTEAKYRGDINWIKKALQKSAQYSVGTSVLIAVAILLLGNWIVNRWTGGHVILDNQLVYASALWCLVCGSMNSVVTYLNGIGRIRLQAIAVGLTALAIIGALHQVVLHTGVGGGAIFIVAIWGLFIVPVCLGDCINSLSKLSDDT